MVNLDRYDEIKEIKDFLDQYLKDFNKDFHVGKITFISNYKEKDDSYYIRICEEINSIHSIYNNYISIRITEKNICINPTDYLYIKGCVKMADKVESVKKYFNENFLNIYILDWFLRLLKPKLEYFKIDINDLDVDKIMLEYINVKGFDLFYKVLPLSIQDKYKHLLIAKNFDLI